MGFVLGERVSVSEAAATAGYSNASHFAKVFRRYYGVNPRCFSALMVDSAVTSVFQE